MSIVAALNEEEPYDILPRHDIEAKFPYYSPNHLWEDDSQPMLWNRFYRETD